MIAPVSYLPFLTSDSPPTLLPQTRLASGAAEIFLMFASACGIPRGDYLPGACVPWLELGSQADPGSNLDSDTH